MHRPFEQVKKNGEHVLLSEIKRKQTIKSPPEEFHILTSKTNGNKQWNLHVKSSTSCYLKQLETINETSVGMRMNFSNNF